MTRPAQTSTGQPAAYVANRLPELSETFVYRELLGLRARGRRVVPVSVRAPRAFPEDARLDALAREAVVVYSRATFAALPAALLAHPLLLLAGLRDALTADHPSVRSRIKHMVQAVVGIGTGWRLRHQGIRHVHAHMAHVPATIAYYIARTIGAGFSFTGHAADLFVGRAALAFKLRRADFVACISHWHQGFYREVADVPSDRLPIVRCSVALPEPRPEGAQEIVTVARLVAKKGIDLLIRAFAASGAADWRLRILGDGPERGALEALAGSLGVADRVTFEGARPHARCLEAVAHGGMFVLPCRTAANGDKDGIPVALMESMAAGRATIAGDLPSIRELIADGEGGILVAPNEVDALADAIRRVAGDAALRERLGRGGRARVEAEFADAVNLDRLTAAFDGAAAKEARA